MPRRRLGKEKKDEEKIGEHRKDDNKKDAEEEMVRKCRENYKD